jgi:hypothetical protein
MPLAALACLKRLSATAAAFVVLGWLSCSQGLAGEARDITLGERLAILQDVYKEHIAAIDETHVKMTSGLELVIDDGRKKSHAEKLADADIEDMLSQIYPVAGCIPPDSTLPADFDPGRIRNEAFFKAIYGASAKEVQARLALVDWFGQKLPIATTLGVDKKMAAVVSDLTPVLATLRKHLIPSAGTFNWRPIAGTSQLSTHSYAIAIDIASSDYWRWSKISPERLSAVRRKIPQEIVGAFERHGFIWGGNWYHFDTMHFEYRPELVAIGDRAKQRGCIRQ